MANTENRPAAGRMRMSILSDIARRARWKELGCPDPDAERPVLVGDENPVGGG